MISSPYNIHLFPLEYRSHVNAMRCLGRYTGGAGAAADRTSSGAGCRSVSLTAVRPTPTQTRSHAQPVTVGRAPPRVAAGRTRSTGPGGGGDRRDLRDNTASCPQYTSHRSLAGTGGGVDATPSGFSGITRERIGRSSRNLVYLTIEQFYTFPENFKFVPTRTFDL